MQERKYVMEEGPQRPEQEAKPLPAELAQRPQPQALERIEQKLDALLRLMEGHE